MTDQDALSRRIARLEREGTRWRRASAAALGLCGVLLFTGQGGSHKVTAESLRLVGPDGKLRGMLSVTDKNTAGLSLMDGNQQVRAALSVDAGGSSKLVFLDRNGKMVTTLGLGSGDLSSLVLQDGAGTTRVSLTTEPAGLVCSDAEGQPRAR